MILDNYEKTVWMNHASTHINLRYPKVGLSIQTPFNINGNGFVEFETFVSNKNMLTLVRDKYQTNRYSDIFRELELLKERFNERCERIKDNYIFNSDTAIQEPFEININNGIK